MDLWQFKQMRRLRSRLDDLTAVVFAFVLYEIWGVWPAVVYLILDMVTRIYQFTKENKKAKKQNVSLEFWSL